MTDVGPCPRCGLTVTSARPRQPVVDEATGEIAIWHLGCWYAHQWEGGHFDRRQRERREPGQDRRTGRDRRDIEPPG